MGVTIPRPDDFHVHLRRGDMLGAVVPYTARHFGRALIMPNTSPPILTADDVVAYSAEILAAVPEGCTFTPLMTIKITDATTPETIRAAHAVGAIAGKAYPQGATTGAEQGVTDWYALGQVWEAMAECGMVLCLHGEDPTASVLEREAAFLPILRDLVHLAPKLKIVLEHVSTEEAVDTVLTLPDTVAATITPHHLVLTLDKVIGDRIAPWLFCKPVPKSALDRTALRRAAASGNPKFFLGTDSAPHLRSAKEAAQGAAGIFNAPVALAVCAQVFMEEHAMRHLQGFVSEHGAAFYGLELNDGQIELVHESWRVPEEYSGLVPLCAGQELAWRVK